MIEATANPRGSVVERTASLLSLAAAPTFAVMAVLTGVADADAAGVHCSTMPHASPLSGMALMYLLMSAFHLGPWLRHIPGARQ